MPRNTSEYGRNYDEPELRYNPEQLRHTSSRQILEAFRDPEEQPGTPAERVVDQRNANWKNGWSDQIPADEKELEGLAAGDWEPRELRAMRFATDLSVEAEANLGEFRREFLQMRWQDMPGGNGPETRDERKWMQDAISEHHTRHPGSSWEPGAGAGGPEQESRKLLEDIKDEFPDYWQEAYQSVQEVAGDGLELGKHLAYIAIIQNDPRGLDKARKVTDDSMNSFRMDLETRIDDDSIIRFRGPESPNEMEPEHTAWGRMGYLEYMEKLAGGGPEASSFMRGVIAERDIREDFREDPRTPFGDAQKPAHQHDDRFQHENQPP